MKRSTASFPLLVLAVLACEVPDVRAPEVGGAAPPFTAVTMDGAEVVSADLRGAPYMLNIWATWCAPCRQEMPELQELHDTYADQGFRVVGVSVDDRGATGQIQAFIEEIDISFPIYHDPTWEIMESYLLLGLPGSFLIDSEGVDRAQVDRSVPSDGRGRAARRAGRCCPQSPSPSPDSLSPAALPRADSRK